MRTVNRSKLRELIKAKGKYAIALAPINGRVSSSVLEKLQAGTYPAVPKEITRELICKYLNATEEELFPRVKPKKSAS